MSNRGGLILAGALLALPVGAFAELPSAEQICISIMNNDGLKVQAAQLKVNDGCVKDGVKTGSDANACIEADAKGKVDKKRDKTDSDATKKCIPAPSVFYAGPTATNDAAEESAKALLRDVFGPTLGALQLCDTNPDECICQTKVINRVSKLERAIGKTWLRCKKAAMKDGKEPFATGGAELNAELEQCVTNGLLTGGLSVESDTKAKISDATSQIEATAAQFCAANSVVDEFAGGACAGYSTPPTIDAPGLADCLRDHAKCRFCEMVNASDALGINCDAWVGIACP